jgi:hypothetical protein
MRKWMKVTILVVLTLGVFAGVGIYDGSQKATQLQRAADSGARVCELTADERGTPREPCYVRLRSELDASYGSALVAALPMALGAVAILWLLIALFWFVRGRKKEAEEA